MSTKRRKAAIQFAASERGRPVFGLPRSINEKIASTKTAAVDNRKPVNRVAEEEAERKDKQRQKAADVWDYKEGETPTARAYIDALRRKIGNPAFL